MSGPAERRLTVDRFEGEWAVVETDGGRVVDVPLWILPEGVREGDVVVLRVDAEATGAARAEAGELLDRLRADDPGGDVVP